MMQSRLDRRARETYLMMMVMAGAVACRGSRHTANAPKNSAVAPSHAANTILLIGTSLTAGYGLDPADAWSTHVQQKIDSAGLAFHVSNAGVSGETSADARHRMPWLLSQGAPTVVVVETGANDGLRGQSIDSLRANLDAVLGALDSVQPRPAIVVAGMEALPNLGRAYGNAFRQVFPDEARSHHAYYLPFLLSGVAGDPALNQADGIHPNARGSRIVADNVWHVLRPVLDSIVKSKAVGRH
jgi:acyl-CoA thioesterase-1